MRRDHAPAPWRSTAEAAVRRALDVTLAATMLLVLALPLLAIALSVRLDTPGPALFRQQRLGLHRRPFVLLKFRSMRTDCDDLLHRRLIEAELGGDGALWDGSTKVPDDPRVTRCGRFLRRTSLDELPQLINVLRGDMSIVGPRPERPHFVDKFGSAVVRYDDRHRVPVGMTGWAQVHGLRGDTSIEERARFDNHYVEHWSLWLDLVIVGRTVGAVVRDVFKRAD